MRENLLKAKFEFILESVNFIQTWFKDVKVEDDFLNTSLGRSHLDATLMRLQAIGEALKKIYGEHPDILRKFPAVEWLQIIKLREIILHHYEQLSHEIIFRICSEDLPILKSAIENILEDFR